MPVSKKVVTELRDKCGLPLNQCKAALEEHDGDVDAALKALIEAGRVKSNQLNPDTVPDELFELAARREKLDMYRQFSQPDFGLAGLVGKLPESEDPGGILKGLADQLKQARAALIGNKTPEELMAEDDARQAERFKEAQKLFPKLKGQKPMSSGEQARLFAQVKRRGKWLEEHPFTLKLSPFPPLKREMHEWTGKDVLTAWAGTQQRHGGYTSLSSAKPSKGTVMIQIPRLGEDDVNPRPPAPEQVAAYAFLKENQDAVTEKIMAALLKYYTKVRRQWLKHDPDLELPDIKTTAQMRKNVGLGTLHMHPHAKVGFAYIGLELGCTWDEEHGAGVLLHRDRIIDVGQADTSFASWKAEEDGGQELK